MSVILFHAVNHSKQMGHSYCMGALYYRMDLWDISPWGSYEFGKPMTVLWAADQQTHCSIWSANKSKPASM